MDTLFSDILMKRRRKPSVHLLDIQHYGEKMYFLTIADNCQHNC